MKRYIKHITYFLIFALAILTFAEWPKATVAGVTLVVLICVGLCCMMCSTLTSHPACKDEKGEKDV